MTDNKVCWENRWQRIIYTYIDAEDPSWRVGHWYRLQYRKWRYERRLKNLFRKEKVWYWGSVDWILEEDPKKIPKDVKGYLFAKRTKDRARKMSNRMMQRYPCKNVK